jgi:queuine tRNA-ribosyltransferase
MQNNIFTSKIIAKSPHNEARVVKVTTPHGEFLSPAFMPVATRAFVNHALPDELKAAGSQIILGGNTYHMLCTPGLEIIEKMGGMHKFMGWHGPMLTDSGGYQVFSLSKSAQKICKIKEDGAYFKHPKTGKIIQLTPQASIAAQKIIGADIIMAFDECTAEEGGRETAIAALQRTHRWLEESKAAHIVAPNSAYGYRQALFGIIQGGSFRDLREESARYIAQLDLDGIGIGGESIGFNMQHTCQIVDWVRPLIPEHKLRYTMGVGLDPQDLIDVVRVGIDIFDCVAPTRNARHGALYCGAIVEENNWLKFVGMSEDKDDEAPADPTKNKSRILIKKAIYATDERPIMEQCACYTCHNYSRAYLHYLFKENSSVYGHLASIHNIHVMHMVCQRMREIIGGY